MSHVNIYHTLDAVALRERRDEAKKTNATVNAYFHMQSQKSDYLHLIHSFIFFSVNSWSDNIHVLCNAYKNTSRSTLNALTRSHARTHSPSLRILIEFFICIYKFTCRFGCVACVCTSLSLQHALLHHSKQITKGRRMLKNTALICGVQCMLQNL